MPVDRLQNVSRYRGELGAQGSCSRDAVQHAGHALNQNGIDFIFHAQLVHARAGLVVVHPLVPIVKQAGKARLLHVEAVPFCQLHAGIRYAQAVCEALGANPLFQLCLAYLEEFL